MTGPNIQTTANNTSFLSSREIDNKNSTIDLCQTCQSSIGGVGEAAEKIKALALGNFQYKQLPA